MKNRTLKELYEVLFNHIKDKTYIPGLCYEIYDLRFGSIINSTEYLAFSKHFESQKYLHPEFMVPERNWSGGISWWTRKEDDNPVNRIAFIEKIISEL